MAKVRDLKKDIDFVTSEIIEECYFIFLLREDVNEEKVHELIARALDMNNEYMRRVNHPDGKGNKALVKKYYKKLHHDLIADCNILVEEVNALSDMGEK